MGIIPWDSPGAGRAWGTQGHFACVTALHAGLSVPQSGEHCRLLDTSGPQEGPKQEVLCRPQISTTSCPGSGSDQGLTLCPLLQGGSLLQGLPGPGGLWPPVPVAQR